MQNSLLIFRPLKRPAVLFQIRRLQKPFEIPYIRWFWELLPGMRRDHKTLKTRQKELSIDVRNPYSFWNDFKDLQRTSGKFYVAPDSLIAQKQSRAIENFDAMNLATGKQVGLDDVIFGRVSLVLFKFREAGEPHLESFRKPFLAEFGKDPDAQCIDCVVSERKTYEIIRSLIAKSLRSRIEPERQACTLLRFGPLTAQRLSFDMIEQFVGWMGIPGRQEWIGEVEGAWILHRIRKQIAH